MIDTIDLLYAVCFGMVLSLVLRHLDTWNTNRKIKKSTGVDLKEDIKTYWDIKENCNYSDELTLSPGYQLSPTDGFSRIYTWTEWYSFTPTERRAIIQTEKNEIETMKHATFKGKGFLFDDPFSIEDWIDSQIQGKINSEKNMTKFKVGDWVISSEYGICLICEVRTSGYTMVSFDNNKGEIFYHIDENSIKNIAVEVSVQRIAEPPKYRIGQSIVHCSDSYLNYTVSKIREADYDPFSGWRYSINFSGNISEKEIVCSIDEMKEFTRRSFNNE